MDCQLRKLGGGIMTFRVQVHYYKFRFKLAGTPPGPREPVACVLPKKPTVKKYREDFGTQAGAKAFADLVMRQPIHPQVIPTWPMRVAFVNPADEEVDL